MFQLEKKRILLFLIGWIACTGYVYAQPTISFVPANGSTGVSENTSIVIISDQSLRRDSDNAALTDANVASVLVLKADNASGADITFTATINASDDQITITPSAPLAPNQLVYVAITNVESTGAGGGDLTVDPTFITFTVRDYVVPSVTFSPSDAATNQAIGTNITISFNEAIRNIDDSEITSGNVASLITLKKTDGSGEDVPFTASINAGKTLITIDPASLLDNNQVYYIELAPIEDAAGNATPISSASFTTTNDTQAPVPTFNPSDGSVDFVNASPIVISFNEAIRDLNDADLTSTTIDSKITLKVNDASGADITFDATIDVSNLQVTVTPSAPLPDFTVIYVAVNNVEDEFDNALAVAQTATFTTGDGTPPAITFNPSDGASGIAVNGNITISFNEAVRNINDSEITDANVASLITFKLTNSGGANVPFTATINAGKTAITVDPTSDLNSDQIYYVSLAAIENSYDIATSTSEITFTTVDTQPPTATFNPVNAATGVSNSANIVITFNEPIRNLDNSALTNTSIDGKIALKLTDASGANIAFDAFIDGTGTIVTVDPAAALPDLTVIYASINNVEDASDNAIMSPLSVTFTTTDGTPPVVTFDPVNGSTSFSITANIVISFNEAIRNANNSEITNANANSLITFRRTSDNVNISFTASINAGKTEITINPTNNLAADVEYSVTLASVEDFYNNSTGTQVTIFSTQSLTVNAGPDKSICNGESTTITAAVSGGNGYYNIQWTSSPAGFTSSSQTISVSPSVNTTYSCVVTDSDGNTNSGSPETVIVTVNETPIATWDPGTKQSFIVNEPAYQLVGAATNSDGITASVGTNSFSGDGVALHGDGDYYFHPDAAGVVSDLPLTFTHTNSLGCSDSDVILVSVSSQSPVLNLEEGYCSNEPINYGASGVLAPNPAVINMANYRYMEFWVAKNTPVTGPLIEVTSSPKTYRLDPAAAAAALGSSDVFYIAVYSEILLFGTPILLPFHVVEVKLYRPGIQPVITSIRYYDILCQSNDPFVLTTSTGSAYTTLSWSVVDQWTNATETPNGITETSPDVYEFAPGTITYPNNEPYRELAMIYRYNDVNGCFGQVAQPFYTVRKPGPPTGENKQYCQFYEGDLTLTAQGEFNYIEWYENENLSDANPPVTSTLNTSLNSAVPQSKDYWVTDDYYGYCQSDPTKITIQITPVPQFTLNVPAQCEGREFSFQGPNGADTYEWLVDRGGPDGEDIIYTEQNPVHTYDNQGLYNVRLRITYTSNANECSANDGTQVTVGVNPEPDFTYSKLCDEDFTEFIGIVPSEIGVERFRWDFGDGYVLPQGNSGASIPGGTHNGTTTNTYKDPHHQFVNAAVPATYGVTVTAITNLGCFGSTTKPVTLLPYLAPEPQNPYNMSDLDGGKGFWTLEDLNGNSTWVFEQPNKTFITSTQNAWVTNATGNYAPDEKSFINSPCFNITSFTKPVIALNYIADTERSYDGAVLEYSNDGGSTWIPLGSTGSGSEWFNTQGFITGNIGSSQVGWSGQLWQGGDLYEWMHGRHKLDNVENKTKVRFRIAFASNATGEFEGFAFNNLSIRERNRNILIENFTNNEFSVNNEYYSTIPEAEAVKIQYHLGFPTSDANFSVNPTDPAARAAFYGIPLKTEYIPRAFVDGLSEGNFTTSWESQYRDLRSLASAPFLINLTVEPIDGELHIKANANVLEAFPADGNRRPVLHVVVVEKTVGTNRYVVRKMLPDATGSLLPLPLVEGTITNDITMNWKVSNAVERTDLAVIAFIQDEITREVYQSAIETSVADPGVITAVEEALFSGMSVYPNPADRSVTVHLRDAARDAYPLRVMDSFGRNVYESAFRKGEQSREIATDGFASGMYFVQIETVDGVVWKKVIVGH